MLPQHLLHHMFPLGGLRHGGSCPREVRDAETQLFLLSVLDGRLRSQDSFEDEDRPFTEE